MCISWVATRRVARGRRSRSPEGGDGALVREQDARAMDAVISHQNVRLGRGRHTSPAEGACVMELASMLAGERFTDRPLTACPVIAAFLRAYNDVVPARWRDDLAVCASLVVNTRCPQAHRAR